MSAYSPWPKACATCGYVITSDGDDLRHIHWHMGYEPQPERYALLDKRERERLASGGGSGTTKET